ncbi:MAG: hypothetical protein WCC06_09450 [Candidatus Aminicenantales bacterium]
MAEEKTKEIRITIPEELFSFCLASPAYEHLLRAKKEALLALRALIDSRIVALEKKEVKKTETKKKIKID